jgi:hypothetical protein
MSGAHELDADRGCDLVGTEDDGKESVVVRLGHLKPRLQGRCSKARSSLQREEQEPGHLERLKNSAQLPANIQRAETRGDVAA